VLFDFATRENFFGSSFDADVTFRDVFDGDTDDVDKLDSDSIDERREESVAFWKVFKNDVAEFSSGDVATGFDFFVDATVLGGVFFFGSSGLEPIPLSSDE